MGTKKGQPRKTARKAYKKKASRKGRGMKSATISGIKMRIPAGKVKTTTASTMFKDGGVVSWGSQRREAKRFNRETTRINWLANWDV